MDIETAHWRRDWPAPRDLQVSTLGRPRFPSPVPRGRMVDESRRVLLCSDLAELRPFLDSGREPPSFEPAGPRPDLFFDPEALTCGIVTCGGLCPGFNNVIRSIVLQLNHAYGVPRILGFRYGFAGLAAEGALEPLTLTPAVVESVHEQGGTLLGSSRGPQDVGDMVDTLARRGVGVLFVIGGDGALQGASALHEEIAHRRLPIGLVGIPKTIDNDLECTWRSFGFDTAVAAAGRVILSAHAEALGAWNGIALVKLMGRHSGFIAAHATLACSDVNFCLVPEVRFTLAGEGGLLQAVERRLEERHHSVIVVAEGAGQELMADGTTPEHDASGNIRLRDIGVFLRDEIAAHFKRKNVDVTVRYIDPSYTIRSLPANSFDAQYCLALGQHAVHAALAGRTNMFVGVWNQRMTHVPIPLAVDKRKRLDPHGDAWQRVLETTGQPARLAVGQ